MSGWPDSDKNPFSAFVIKALGWMMGFSLFMMFFDHNFHENFIPWLNKATQESPLIPYSKTFTTAVACIALDFVEGGLTNEVQQPCLALAIGSFPRLA